MVKQAIKRKHPQFSEHYLGYRSFSHLLQEAQRKNLLALERDERSGGYIIRTAD
mgnify:FL=1